MADDQLSLVLQDLQNHLQSAKIQVENLSTIARNGDEKLVEQFMTENVFERSNGNQKVLPQESQTVLHSQLYVACFWGFRDIVRGIFEAVKEQDKELNPNHQNKRSLWTPLHAATFQEHGPIVMMLLENGSQPELPDSEGRTPKDFASASDKVWSHFAALGLTRTPKPALVKMGIIKKLEESPISSAHSSAKSSAGRRMGSGIRMASYSRPESAYAVNSDPFLAASGSGDVLAGDESAGKNMQATQQPRLTVFK